VHGAVRRRVPTAFPLGILLVNLSGALALGVLDGAGVEGDARELVGVGLLGAYTTFSTWIVDTYLLGRGRRPGLAALNLALSLALGLAAAALGRTLGAG
jgi:CrcB protein